MKSKKVIKKTTQQIKQEEQTREKMVIYYKWFFSIFFIIFSIVLFYEKLWTGAVCMLVLGWYYIPLKFVRNFDKKLGKWKKFLFWAAILGFIFSCYILMRQLT